MAKPTNSASLVGNAMDIGLMMIEAQSVIAMRLMGMAGLWSVSPQENHRMVAEKLEAMFRATSDAGMTTLRGGSPDEIAAAAIAPLRRATSANSKRLRKRGPKLG